MFGYVLINDEARRTLTPGIMIFKGPHLTDWGSLMAASTIAVLPVALCFVWLQRFLVEGLSAGAVKGSPAAPRRARRPAGDCRRAPADRHTDRNTRRTGNRRN